MMRRRLNRVLFLAILTIALGVTAVASLSTVLATSSDSGNSLESASPSAIIQGNTRAQENNRAVQTGVPRGINWSSLPLEGGEVEVVTVDPTNSAIVYAGTRGGGLFKSIDSGATWTASNNGLVGPTVNDVVIHPVTATTVYAGTDHGVFKSIDGGATWNNIGSDGGSSIIIDPTSPDTIYTDDIFYIYKTTDGGANWSQILSYINNIAEIEINPSDTNILYAALNTAGVHKSTDGGITWSAVYTGALGIHGIFYPTDLVIHPTMTNTLYVADRGAGGVYKSTDGGVTWAAVNTGLPVGEAQNVTALTIDPQTPDTVYAGTYDGLYQTTDGAANWSSLGTGFDDSSFFEFNSITIDPQNSANIFAGRQDGFYKSTNSGALWSPTNSGLHSVHVNALAYDPTMTTTLYAGGANGVHKSTDSGATWTAINTGLINAQHISGLAVDPTTPTTLYVAGAGSSVYKSTNGGANWSGSGSGIPVGPGAEGIVIDPVTPATLYVSTSSGVYKSTDSGASWSASSSGLPNSDVWRLVIDPNTPSTLYVTIRGGGLYKSVDSGATWSQSDTGMSNAYLFSLAIAPSDSNTLYAGTDTVFRSLDAGASWTEVNNGIGFNRIDSLVVDSTNSSIVYAGATTNGGANHAIYLTIDGGDNWRGADTGLETIWCCTEALMLTPAPNGMLYAGSIAGVSAGQTIPNQAPIAVDDTYNGLWTNSQHPLTTVLNNDSDPNGDALTVTAVGSTSYGVASIWNSGAGVYYSPTVQITATEIFTYTISDGLVTDTATITLTLVPPPAPNQAPNAVNDTYNDLWTMQQHTLMTILDNDSDPNNNPLFIIDTGPTTYGVATITNGGGFIHYSPTAQITGTETFTYTITDGFLTDTATVTINLVANRPNQAPIANDYTYTNFPTDRSYIFTSILSNDIDPDGDLLFITALGPTIYGETSIWNGGAGFHYTPTVQITVTEIFTYTVSDGVLTDTATVSIGLVPPPLAVVDQIVTQGTPAAINLTNNGRQIDMSLGANALPAGSPTTTLRISDAPNGNIQFGQFSFSIDAYQNGALIDDFQFDPANPPQLTINYRDDDILGDEALMTLKYFNEGTGLWQTDGITIISRDTAANTITVTIAHLTDFALFDGATGGYTIYLPLIMRP